MTKKIRPLPGRVRTSSSSCRPPMTRSATSRMGRPTTPTRTAARARPQSPARSASRSTPSRRCQRISKGVGTGHYSRVPAHRSAPRSPQPKPEPTCGQAALLNRARSGPAHQPRELSDLPGSLAVASGANPFRADPDAAAPRPPSECSTAYPDDLDCSAITDQSVPRSAADPRSHKRSHRSHKRTSGVKFRTTVR